MSVMATLDSKWGQRFLSALTQCTRRRIAHLAGDRNAALTVKEGARLGEPLPRAALGGD